MVDRPRRWWRGRRAQVAGLAAFGLLLLAIAVDVAAETVRWLTYDATVTGEVTARGDGSKSCTSDVGFVVDGERHATTWHLCRTAVGQPVTVRYDADDPARATADGWQRIFLYRLPFGLVAGALVVPVALGAVRTARAREAA